MTRVGSFNKCIDHDIQNSQTSWPNTLLPYRHYFFESIQRVQDGNVHTGVTNRMHFTMTIIHDVSIA
jgi:hypothetical protein